MRRTTRSLALLTALPVLAIADPASAAQPRAFANSGPLLAGPQAANADATALGALGVGVLPDQRLLAGADGQVTISLSSRVDAPTTVSDVDVDLSLPDGYRARSVTAVDWRCTVQARDVSCRAPGRAEAGSHSPIEVELDALPAETRSSVRVGARATWTQSGSRYSASDATFLEPSAGLAVRADASDRDTLSALPGGDAFPIVLSGRLAHFVDGMPTTYSFRQVCGPHPSDCQDRAPPKVRFTTPNSGTATDALVTTGIVAPEVSHETTLWFELTADDWRGSDSDTVAVHVSPQRDVKLEPRVGKVTGTDETTLDAGQIVTQGVTRTIVVSGSALAGPRPGETARLIADGSPGRLVRPRWSVVEKGGRERRILEGFNRTRHILSFRVPKHPPAGVTVRIRGLVNGRRVSTDVNVRFRRPVQRARASAAADDTPEEDKGPFCTLWEAAESDPGAGTTNKPIELAGDTKVTLGGATRTGDKCDAEDASVKFNAGTIEVTSIKDLRFGDVSGTVTAKGMSITDAWYEPPQWSFLAHSVRAYHVIANEGFTFSAPLTDDAWGPLTGELQIPDAIEWISLPAGWTYQAGKTVLSFQAGKAVELRTEAKAPKGQSGTVAFSGSFLKDGGVQLSVDAQKVVTIDSGSRMGSGPSEDRAVYLSGKGSVTIKRKKQPDTPETPATGDAPAAYRGAGDPTPADPDAAKKWDYEGSVSLNTDPADKELELTPQFHVKGLSGTWDKKGFRLSGTGIVLVKDQRLEVNVAGQYKSKSQWKLAATQKTPWKLTNDVAIQGVCGLVERRPFDPKIDGPQEEKPDDKGDKGDKKGEADKGVEDKDKQTACEKLDKGQDPGEEEEDTTAADPNAPPEDHPDVFRVAFGGSVTGWSPSDQIKNINADALLTNRCAADEKACNNGDVRLRIGVKGEAKIPHVAPFKFDAMAQVNLTTKQVTFKGGRELTGLGPPEFKLSKANLELSTGGTGWCKPKPEKKDEPEDPNVTPVDPAAPPEGGDESAAVAPAADAPTPEDATPDEEAKDAPELTGKQKLTFTASAEGVVFSQRFTTKAEFTPKGYCLAALFNKFDPKLNENDNTERKLFENVGLYFASAPVELKFSDRTIKLDGKGAEFSGDFNAGSNVPKETQGPLAGKGQFTARLTKTDKGLSFKGAVSYKLTKTYPLFGGTDPKATRFGIDDARLDVEYKPGDFALSLSAGGTLATPASDDGKILASTTPLRATAGLKIGSEESGFTLTANVDTSRLPSGKLENAFGQQGLTVEKLIVSASLGTVTSFGVAAQGTLPQRWVQSFGAERDVPIAVALKIAQPATKSCLEVKIGDKPDSKKAVAKIGALTATYARVLVAPGGCTIGTGLSDSSSYNIKPGFALAFTGSIGAAPVRFSAEATRKDSGSFAVKGDLSIGKFDMGAASFDETIVKLDIDPEDSKYNIEVSGGLKVGESSASLNATLKATKTSVTATFDGSAKVRFAGFTFAEGKATADIAMSQKDDVWKIDKLAVKANTTILGITTYLEFAYANGGVDAAAAAFNVNAQVGPSRLGGGALFAYHRKGATLTGNDCAFNANTKIEPDANGKQVYMRVCGDIKFGSFNKSLRFTLAIPHRIPVAFDTGRVNIPLGPASIHIEAALDAGLDIGIGPPTFAIRDGRAVAGGCLNLLVWKGCADAINLKFERASGYFVGTFLGFNVRWGDPAWKATAPQETPQEQPAFLPSLAGSQRRIPFWRGSAAARWKPLNGGERLQSGVPASDNQSGVFSDPMTREVIMFWCVESTGASSCKRSFLMRASQFRDAGAFTQEGLRRDTTYQATEVELIDAGGAKPTTKTVTANGQPVVSVVDFSGVTTMKLTPAGRAAAGTSDLPEMSVIPHVGRSLATRPLPSGDTTNGSSPSAVVDPGTGVNVFFAGKDGAMHAFTRESGAWTDYPLGGSVAPGTNPSAIYDARTGGRNVFYVGKDNAMYLMSLSSGGWVHTKLGGSVDPGTSPSAVVDPASGRQVLFVGDDLALHDLFQDNGKWIDYKIGGKVSPGSSPSAVVDPASGRNVFFVGQDGAMHDYYISGGWTDFKIPGGSPALGSTPSAIVDPSTGRNVFYVDKDGAIHDQYISNGWQDYKLGGSVALGSTPSAMVDSSSGRNIFFAGTDGAMHDYYVNGNAWSDYRMGGTVTPGTSPSAISDSGTGRNVFYVGANRALRQFVVATTWQDNLLGGTVGG